MTAQATRDPLYAQLLAELHAFVDDLDDGEISNLLTELQHRRRLQAHADAAANFGAEHISIIEHMPRRVARANAVRRALGITSTKRGFAAVNGEPASDGWIPLEVIQ